MEKELNDSRKTRIGSLTGVRFPAIFLVFLAHVYLAVPFSSQDAATWYFHYFGGIGKVGVSFFYLLSGFILAWSPRKNDSPVLFWRRRLTKILPMHWLTYALSMIIFASSAVTGTAAVLNFFMLQAWSSSPEVFGSVNAPSWSLSCLLVFYLLFPWLNRAVARIRTAYLWWCVAAIVAVIAALPAIVREVVSPDPMLTPQAPASSPHAFWIIQLFPMTRLLDFTLGILMARIVRTGKWIGVRPLPLALLLVAAYLASHQVPREYRLVAVMIVPLTLFIASLAASDLAGRPSLLASRPVQWLGDLSYAFFLVHWPVMMFFVKVFGTRLYTVPQAIGVMALDFTVALGLAWLLTVAVERPLVRRFAKPRRPEYVTDQRSTPAPAGSAGRLSAVHPRDRRPRDTRLGK
ncbi:acyltransferase family protein [Streptomyces violaceusniger]|uniref:Acyltransferase n=1 Tax=Streptomyces violaceusniger TaxID=68280 RepID=A0A4D4L968_STRVO|nr:acyltransferase [Streptomyces violaceusniger]